MYRFTENEGMQRASFATGSRAGITAIVRDRIDRGGERLWRLDDFSDLPFSAVAQALSRLVRDGYLDRQSKGVYYRSRDTAFGRSKPNPAAIGRLAERRKRVFPAGIAAASLLGLTTQTTKRSEVATSAMSLPRKLIGADTVVHANRPETWSTLTPTEAAILDVLRSGARFSELSPPDMVKRLKRLLREEHRMEHLLRVASSEPPRVRAMLGALAEQMNGEPRYIQRLRESLNPLSRFDFGPLAILPNARQWQARERSRS